MARRVWKYEIGDPILMQHIARRFAVPMPKGADVLHVGVQFRGGEEPIPCAWALVDPDAELQPKWFFCAGTGEGDVPADAKHVGTVQIGRFVWHYFTVWPDAKMGRS